MEKGGFMKSLLWSLLAKPLSELLTLFGACLFFFFFLEHVSYFVTLRWQSLSLRVVVCIN